MVFYIVGVTPEEEKSEPGLGGAAVCQLLRRMLAEGYHSLVAALMPEDARSRGLVGREAIPAQRRYTLYEVNL